MVDGKLVAVDVHYRDPEAVAALVAFEAWTDAEPCDERVARLAPVEPYRPGRFFLRELPCLLRVLDGLEPRGRRA